MRNFISFTRVVFAAVAVMGIAAQGEVKVVRVVPSSEAPETADGASWATAYGDIKTAYESLGAEGGEVWIKQGLYVMTNAVELAANIGVYGGFAGTETSRAAADPKNNLTLISGDQELNDRLMTGSFRAWRYNEIVSAWDYETLTYNTRTPSFTADSRGNYYAWSAWPQNIASGTTPGMTSDDNSNQRVFDTLADTACAFYRTAETPSVGTVAFEGLVFSGFKTNVFNVAGSTGGETPDASRLEIRNCRFLACCNGLAGRNGPSFGPLYVRNMKTSVSDCEFSHCVNGINFAAPGLLTDETALVVSNCQFRYVFLASSGLVAISNAGHPTPDASPKFHVVDCTFTGNFNPNGNSCGLSLLANGLVERCVFTQNYAHEYPAVMLYIYGMDPNSGGGSPRLEIRDCRFVGNEIRNERGSNSTTAIMTGTAANFKTSSTGYPIVRNCYFADNKIVRYRVRTSYPNGVCYYQGGKCSLLFINCAAENNTIEYIGSEDGATGDISTAYNSMFFGKGIFVNCAVRGSKFIDSSTKVLNPTFCEFTSNATFVNTVVHNDNEDGNYRFALGTFFVYSTLATGRQCGTDGEGNPVYDDLSGISFSKTRPTANGTPMFRVLSAPDKRPCRPVWEIGYDIAVYDPDYNKAKPWRTFNDYRKDNSGCRQDPPAALVDGLNDTAHLIPDANGKARRNKYGNGLTGGEAYGPLCAMNGGLFINIR